jgi:hypothetical protein
MYDSLHPAMLRALAMIARKRKYGIDLRLCGEMAGDPMCGDPDWAWVSPSVDERSLGGAGEISAAAH